VQNSQNLLSTLIPMAIIFVVVVLRMRRMSGVRPMKLQMLWVRPALFSLVAATIVYSMPPQSALQGLVLLAAVAVGAVLGWHQAKLMELSVNSETGTLQVKSSLIATASFVGLILLRMALRPWLTGASSPVHAYVGVVTDSFMLFIVGFYGARAIEMFIRGRALLTGQVGK
jgi:Protein of unknown function (DUF1453)